MNIPQEQLAAARMAQMFGSDLLKVDQMTVEAHGQPAQRLDPRKFITAANDEINRQQNESQRFLEEQNRRLIEDTIPYPPGTEPPGYRSPMQMQPPPLPPVSELPHIDRSRISTPPVKEPRRGREVDVDRELLKSIDKSLRSLCKSMRDIATSLKAKNEVS